MRWLLVLLAEALAVVNIGWLLSIVLTKSDLSLLGVLLVFILSGFAMWSVHSLMLAEWHRRRMSTNQSAAEMVAVWHRRSTAGAALAAGTVGVMLLASFGGLL